MRAENAENAENAEIRRNFKCAFYVCICLLK